MSLSDFALCLSTFPIYLFILPCGHSHLYAVDFLHFSLTRLQTVTFSFSVLWGLPTTTTCEFNAASCRYVFAVRFLPASSGHFFCCHAFEKFAMAFKLLVAMYGFVA